MWNNTQKNSNIIFKVTSTVVLLLYCIATIASFFPAFHNHGPLVHSTPFQNDTCCCNVMHTCNDNAATVIQNHDEQVEHSAGHHCPACMLQSIVKTPAVFYNVPSIGTQLERRKFSLPNFITFYCAFFNLQHSRAPPA